MASAKRRRRLARTRTRVAKARSAAAARRRENAHLRAARSGRMWYLTGGTIVTSRSAARTAYRNAEGRPAFVVTDDPWAAFVRTLDASAPAGRVHRPVAVTGPAVRTALAPPTRSGPYPRHTAGVFAAPVALPSRDETLGLDRTQPIPVITAPTLADPPRLPMPGRAGAVPAPTGGHTVPQPRPGRRLRVALDAETTAGVFAALSITEVAQRIAALAAAFSAGGHAVAENFADFADVMPPALAAAAGTRLQDLLGQCSHVLAGLADDYTRWAVATAEHIAETHPADALARAAARASKALD